MNGKKAKAIRRAIYGQNAQRGTREYNFETIELKRKNIAGEFIPAGSIETTHLLNVKHPASRLRKIYQATKRAFARGEK